MRFSKINKSRADVDIVITSLLDINFLLIMFFMTAAKFQMESRAELDLPLEAGELDAQPDESGLVINLTADGAIIVHNKEVELDDLRELVQAEVLRQKADTNDSLKLMVRADRNANTTDLNDVVSMLRQLGVAAIRVGTHVPQ